MYTPDFSAFFCFGTKFGRITKNYKVDDFMRYLQFSQFFVMLLSESIAMQLRILKKFARIAK